MENETSNKKILLIEDDEFLSRLLAGRLEKEFNITFAPDAEKGIEELRQSPKDLIIVDVLLPGMSGIEFIKKIKADPELAKIPVLILSNLGQRDEINEGIRLGALDYLVKAHLDLGEIVTKIKEALSR